MNQERLLKEKQEEEEREREQKKIVMEEKIQEWLKMKREQVQNRCFKSKTESQFLIKLCIYTVMLQLSKVFTSLICFPLTLPGEAWAACKTEQRGGGVTEEVGKTEGD